MQGFIILIISFLILFLISHFSNLKPLTNFKNKSEYIPIITSNIFADLLIIFVTFSTILGNNKSWNILANWYKTFRLSAFLADTLIGILYLLITRFLVFFLKLKPNLFMFGVYAVLVQLFFDFIFYILFSLIKKNNSYILDFFKNWAKFAKFDALWGDSILVIFAVILSSFLNTFNLDINLFLLIFAIYLVPYFIWMKK